MKLTKKQIEQIGIYEEELGRFIEAQKENKDYYLSTGWRKELNAVNTACARASVAIHEDVEWDKYGSHVTGRSVAIADVPAVITAMQSLIDEIEASKGGVKREWASTTKGETSYARSAVGVFISARSGESYQDA